MEMLVFSPVTELIAKLFGYASYGVPQRKRPGGMCVFANAFSPGIRCACHFEIEY